MKKHRFAIVTDMNATLRPTDDADEDASAVSVTRMPSPSSSRWPAWFGMGELVRWMKGVMWSGDVAHVRLPIFILEPRSLLERLTDVFGHVATVLEATRLTDPKDRFLSVVKFYLSGWHLKPKGVKKPYWPVLGEFFRCQWRYRDHSQAFYIAEQVPSSSSSAPSSMSVFYYACPEHDLVVTGQLRPSSRWLGNTVITALDGHTRLFLTHQKDEEMYEMTLPDIYVRGIVFGRMFTELGKPVTIVCPKTDLACHLEFRTKVS
jgi:hypothetical protein